MSDLTLENPQLPSPFFSYGLYLSKNILQEDSPVQIFYVNLESSIYLNYPPVINLYQYNCWKTSQI